MVSALSCPCSVRKGRDAEYFSVFFNCVFMWLATVAFYPGSDAQVHERCKVSMFAHVQLRLGEFEKRNLWKRVFCNRRSSCWSASASYHRLNCARVVGVPAPAGSRGEVVSADEAAEFPLSFHLLRAPDSCFSCFCLTQKPCLFLHMAFVLRFSFQSVELITVFSSTMLHGQ